jgi:hypothetical protein
LRSLRWNQGLWEMQQEQNTETKVEVLVMARYMGLGGSIPVSGARPVPTATGVNWNLRKPDPGLIANPEDDPRSDYYVDDEPATVIPVVVEDNQTPELKPGKPDPGLLENPEDDPTSDYYVDDEPTTVIEEETASEVLPFVLLGALAFLALAIVFVFDGED